MKIIISKTLSNVCNIQSEEGLTEKIYRVGGRHIIIAFSAIYVGLNLKLLSPEEAAPCGFLEFQVHYI